MTSLRNNNLLIASLIAIFAVGCAQQNSSDATLTKEAPNTVLGKPGASVQFSHKLRAPVSAGTAGTIDFTVSEEYGAGALWLQATGDNGLKILSGNAPVRYEMYSVSTHNWSVSFSADNDGVYYLNVLATVEPEGQSKSSRAHAVRIEIGDVSQITTKAKNGEVSQSPDGDPVIILDAEETIEE